MPLIDCQFTNAQANAARNNAWATIVNRVNAVNGGLCIRTADDLRKKLCDIKVHTKKKYATLKEARLATGGRELGEGDLTETEWKVVSFMGLEVIEGISTGLEVGAENKGALSTPMQAREDGHIDIDLLRVLDDQLPAPNSSYSRSTRSSMENSATSTSTASASSREKRRLVFEQRTSVGSCPPGKQPRLGGTGMALNFTVINGLLMIHVPIF